MKERQTPLSGDAARSEAPAKRDVDVSKNSEIHVGARESQRGEGNSVSAASGPLPSPPQNPTAAPAPPDGQKPRRFRGRRRIRERCQVRARLDELAGKLERGQIDAKTAAIMVQALNGILSCLNAEHDEDFDKRLAALEAKQGGPKKRGGDA